MKVLFLDVDGVLNSAERPAQCREGGIMGIDPVLTSRLVRVLLATGAKVVVSSAWRICGIDPGSRFFDCLSAADPTGLVLGRIIGKTADGWARRDCDCRGDEIQLWLDSHKDVTAFAIVDDDAGMGHLEDHCVRTSWAEGLTEELADKLIEKLGRLESEAA